MIRLVAFAAATFVCASALAQDDIHPALNSKYWVGLGGYFPEHTLTLSVDGTDQIKEKEIEFGRAVDLSDRKGLWLGEFGWQFGEKWSVTAQYFQTKRSKNFTLNEEIEWDDLIFKVGVDITAGTDASVTRLYFSRKMLQPGRHDLRLGLGIHRMAVGAFIKGSATLNDMSTEFRSEDVVAKAPLPNIGTWYRYSPSNRWAFTLRADYFSASFGEISGELIDLRAGINFRVFEHAGVTLNYQRLSINGQVDAENWSGSIDVVYDGPQLVISGYW